MRANLKGYMAWFESSKRRTREGRFLLRAFVPLLLVAAFGTNCNSEQSGDDDDLGPAGKPNGRQDTTVRIPGSSYGGDGSLSLNPLCGEGSCVPDTNEGCEAPSSVGGGGGGEGGSAGSAGASNHFGGEALGWAGEVEGASQRERIVGEACRVTTNKKDESCTDGQCPVERACAGVGAAEEFGPCFSTTDCGAGLACVGAGDAGMCRRYCCDETSCGSGAFCEVGAELGTGLSVPVCANLTACSMLEDYPCPKGSLCACGTERACAIVKSDGSTGCVVPGEGLQGEACLGLHHGECAAGYVCSKGLGCLQVCEIGVVSACPTGALCQAPAEFPAGLGVCVDGPN